MKNSHVILNKNKESHNFLCSLFLFDFYAKRCYARRFVTNNGEIETYSKENYSNGTSHQGQSPRTPIHVITRKQAEQSMKQPIQSDVVISNTVHQCHPETLTRICNVHSSSRTNSALRKCIQTHTLRHSSVVRFVSQREMAKDVKNLLPYSLNALLPKKKLAFTLAEVLITIGIIGIIAAMTIPNLITNYKRKELQTQFNKTYAIVNQALKLTMNDLELDNSTDFKIFYDKNQNNLKQNFVEINKVWESKFKGATKIDKQAFIKKKAFIHDFWGNLWPYAQSYSAFGTFPDNTFLILPNGAQISYLGYDGNVNYQSSIALVVFFDTNGPYKGPNRMGYDMFFYYNDGKIHNYYLAPSCTPLATPINSYWQGIQYCTCSIYAIKNINPYDSSKKYWDGLYKPKSWWEELAKKSK